MCLAVPVRIEQIIDAETALADMGGIRKQINIALIPDLNVGEYVILHVGYALSRIDPDEAEKTLALFAELEALKTAAEGNEQA